MIKISTSKQYRLLLLVSLSLLSFGPITVVNAQFQSFSLTNVHSDARIISASGALTVYDLKLTILPNGIIKASGTRYNVANNGVSPSPESGTPITNAASPISKLGLPLVATTNISTWTDSYWDGVREVSVILTNSTIESSCYAALYLNDSMKAKGTLTSVENARDFLDYSSWPPSVITYSNKSMVWSWPATYKAGFGSFTGSAD